MNPADIVLYTHTQWTKKNRMGHPELANAVDLVIVRPRWTVTSDCIKPARTSAEAQARRIKALEDEVATLKAQNRRLLSNNELTVKHLELVQKHVRRLAQQNASMKKACRAIKKATALMDDQ